MALNASDILVETMLSWGIDTIFGIPGDGINGVIEALRKRQDKVRFIQTRHEESAAFMACAYAKYTGKLGCCLATSGPGAIHLLNGLYDAKMDNAPVLAITGQTYSDLQGSNFQQDVNVVAIFSDVAVYNQEVMNPGQIEMLANEACRHAVNHRGVAHINIPVDIQVKEPDGVSMHKRAHDTSKSTALPRPVALRADVEKAAEILNQAKRPAILVGAGALGTRTVLEQVAELIAAPVVKALLGKGVLPDDHPLSMGGLGLVGTLPAEIAMEHCDVLFLIGTSFPYSEFLPKPGSAIGIQIDYKADKIGLRYPVEVGLVGDSAETLRALLPLLHRREDREFLEGLQEASKKWWEAMEEQARHDDPIRPQQVAWDLNDLLEPDAIVSADSGTNTIWAARQIRLRDEQMFSCSGMLASMGCGVPYAIAAKLAFPGRQSIAFVGDGGFAMLMGEFATACKYELPIVVVIVKNNTLGQIKWEQIVFLGNPEYACDLQPIDFAKVAEACGGVGISVEKAKDLKPALQRAFSCGKACVVEVAVNPNEPPMPARITLKQAENFSKAMLRGEPDGKQIALTIFRDKLAGLL